MAYENEAEQVEAIKKWWKENGISVLTGIVLGFALLFGWRTYQDYTAQQASQASVMYEQVLYALDQGEKTKAREMASKLLSEHSNSDYAILTALNLARQDLEDNDIEAAHARLQWVIDQNKSESFNHLARLRKARLYLAQEKIDAAQQIVNVKEIGQFAGAYAELRGDIAVANKDKNVARIAYEEALNGEDLSQAHRQLVQMKLDDVGGKKSDEKQVVVATPPTQFESETANTTEDENKTDTVSEVTQPTTAPEEVPVTEETATEKTTDTTLPLATNPIVSAPTAPPVLEPEEKKTDVNVEPVAETKETAASEEKGVATEKEVVQPTKEDVIEKPKTEALPVINNPIESVPTTMPVLEPMQPASSN